MYPGAQFDARERRQPWDEVHVPRRARVEPRVPGPDPFRVVEPADEVADEHETVGQLPLAFGRRDQALVGSGANRVGGGDDAAATPDLVSREQLGEPIDALVG